MTPISDDMVERAARALWRVSAEPHNGDDWEHGSPEWHENFRVHARAALTAALEGSVAVPREPTTAMLAAGQKAWREDETKRSSTLWRAMWDAAQSVTRQDRGGEA